MNKNILLLAFGAVAVAAISYGLVSNNIANNKVQAVPMVQFDEIQPSSRAFISLNAQNISGETGTAEINEEDGNLKITLRLSDVPNGVEQPAHIHVGSCSEDVGEVKYPLSSVVDGMSETVLENITLDQLRDDLPLAINVHKSTDEADIFVSCGDIKPL